MNTMYWLRNDLRLHDNECLHQAIAQKQPLLLVYCIDPRQFRALDLGFKKTGFLRYQFLKESLENLRSQLQLIGSNLLITSGLSEQELPKLAEKYNVDQVIFQKEITTEEVEVEAVLQVNLTGLKPSVACNSVWGLTLYHIDDAPFSPENTPLTSKAFRIPLGKKSEVRPCFATPKSLPPTPENVEWGEVASLEYLGLSSEEISDTSCYPGGETAGLQRLDHYTFQTEQLTSYRWTRNRSLGMEYSSKFSPWMALGCLSPRQIYWTINEYESAVKKNASTWWLVFELVWRDYFKFLSLRFSKSIFNSGGFRKKEVEWKYDEELFNKWRLGATGIPFVDAHMRELNETGFMSNRGRVNCASFLTRDYRIDWRWGAAWFENRLLDYDVSSNWLNWSNQAMDIWYTNPVHQGLKYDKQGDYVHNWIPELKKVPGAVVQAPWLLNEVEKKHFAAALYPEPVEIYKKWTRSINNIEKARTDSLQLGF